MTNPTNKRITRAIATAASIVMLTLGAACGGSSDAAKSSNPLAQDTVTPGTLTIATGDPAYTPWVIGDKPESGKGYEAAVSYAVAKKLGFSKSEVKWTRTTFDSAVAPGSKDWDMNIQQFGITAERRKAVDFSPSYFNVDQSVVVLKNGKFANAKGVKDLSNATIGAMVGTSSYDFATKRLKSGIQTFNDNAVLAQALNSNQIDALVVDTPTAVNIVRSKQVKNGLVVGRIPDSNDPVGDGIVLPKGSKLTPAVTKAVNTLKKDGTLTQLQNKWLKDYMVDVPKLSK